MVKGLTQVIALAGETSAVAMAPMSAVAMPKYRAISVETGLPRDDVRRTATRTCVASPDESSGNVTSAGVTETLAFMTWLFVAAAIAVVTEGPDAERSSKSSKNSAAAPPSAPASAAFCAWFRAVISMPTSMASMLALRNAMQPRPMNT